MKKHLLLLLLVAMTGLSLNAQVYIDQSHTYGTDQREDVESVIFQGDFAYYLGTTRSETYPVTNTSQSPASLNTAGNTVHTIYKKVNKSTGAVVASAYVGPQMFGTHFKVRDGKVYVVGSAYQDYTHPTKFNSPNPGGNDDYLYMEIDENTGDMLYGRYFGSTGYEDTYRMDVSDNYVVFGNYTNATDLPVTDTTTNTAGDDRLAIFVLDKASRNVVYSTYFEGASPNYQYLEVSDYILDGNKLYIIGYVNSTDNYTTVNDVNNFSDNGGSTFLARLDLTTYTWDYRTHFMNEFYVATYDNRMESIAQDNNYLYILGDINQDAVPPYTATNGTSASDPTSSVDDIMYLKVDKNTGGIVASAFVGGSSEEDVYNMHVDGNSVFIAGRTRSDDLYVTDGSTRASTVTFIYDGFYSELDKNTGNIIKSGYLGGTDVSNDIRITSDANHIYMAGIADDMITINGGRATQVPTNKELFYIKKDKSSGQTLFAGFIGGDISELEPYTIHADSGYAYIAGQTNSSSYYNYPITTPGLPSSYGSRDFYYMRMACCDVPYTFPVDTLSPASQSVCQFGYVPAIDGQALAISGDSLPLIYRNLTPESQGDFEATYQWQESSTATGPWVNVSAGILEDYQPSIGGTTQYYRRLAYIKSCGENNLVSTSSVAVVNTNANTAPTADAGGPATSCPGSTVTIGGAPAATGGTSPYTYQWFRGSDTVAFDTVPNPITSAQNTSINTLWVTDANGCVQIDQGVLNILEVDAGTDIGNCGGDSAIIQAQGAPGLAGTTYSWLPTSGLDCATCLQPTALVSGVVDYEVTMTIPKTGGGTCTTVDTMQMIATPAPSTANFAGADKVICFPGSTQIGTTAEANFTYTWAPGNFLSSNSQSLVTYDPGSLTFPPTPDSAVYYLTAELNGCVYVDTVVVDVIRAYAGQDGCGPRTLGQNTDVPTLNEQFIWTKISGDGSFIGATNIPYPQVTATTTGSSIYQLQTIYKGDTCTDQVTVPQCGCGVNIAVVGEFGCPNANLGPVTLKATSNLGSSVTYDWSPKVGLSNYNSATVALTDLTARTYTVSIRSTIDTSQVCTDTIFVNGPNMNLPVFSALDTTICPGDTIAIGAPTVAAYSYLWAADPTLSSQTVSDPVASNIMGTTDYTVTVTDVSSGCIVRDTSSIVIRNVGANAGPDWAVCQNAIIQLGTPAVAGRSYAWTPQAPWQNGTDSTFAQAEPLIAANLDFYLVVTDSLTGCTAFDTVSVVVNNNPTIPNYADATLCAGGSVFIGGDTALPGVTYSWTPTTGLINPTDLKTEVVGITSNQNYTLTASFPGNCAAPAIDAVAVTVDNFAFSLTDTTYCPSSGAFSLGGGVPAGLSSYSWSPGNLVSNATTANPNTLNPPPSAETSYTVTATNANGCIDTAVRTITPTAIAASAGSNKSICINGTTVLGSTLNATGAGITYSWSPTADLSCTTCVDPTFTPSAVGTFNYTLTRTDATGCSTTDEVQVIVKSLPITALPQPVICQNTSVQIGTTPSAGNTYVWSPTTGLSNPNISNPIAAPTATTFYTLTVVGANGCVAAEPVAVTVNTTPSPTVEAMPVTICQSAGGGVMNATATPAGSYSYLWTPSTGLSSTTVLNPSFLAGNAGSTVYTLTVTDGTTGCTGFDTALITIDDCLASIGNFVWNDLNEDGIQDSNEVGVPGVTVYLVNAVGQVLDSTITSPLGLYSFTDLTPTTYGIQFDLNTLPAGFVVSPQDAGTDDALDSDGSPIDGKTALVTLTENENNTTLDLGIHTFVSRPNNLGDRVWNDLNNDGIQDAGEVGVAGITVTLYDNDNNVIGTTVTDAYGNYLFTDLVDGDYSVGFTLPANYVFSPQDAGSNDSTDSDVNPITGQTSTYSLSGGETNLTADAGIYFEPVTPPASVGDYVWFDTNNDGIQDPTEVGISGVTVTLYDTSGAPVATVITDANGGYLFTDVPPGDYTVGFTPPVGLGFSPNVGGVTDPNNSDANPITGQTAPFTVNPGDQITSIDAGLSPLPTTVGSLGDRVWYDTDQDGVQDAGEVGVAGVPVTLYAADGTTVIATTVTDAFGNYIFSNLAAGQYVVGFTTPSGFTTSPQGAGSDTTLNSDASIATGKTAVIDLAAGQHNMTIDAGIYNSTPTNNNSIGDYVWLDENQDGIQDAGEEGAAGVTVTLYDASNNPIGTTTTDANGYYLFPGLPNGDYSVGFSNLPTDFVFSPTGAGTSGTDSDPNPITGQTGTVSLTGGTNITDLDAGIYQGDMNIGTASLGDKVWYDVNGDGIQDPNELGVAGVTVYLYDSTGTNIIDSTVTDALGNYIFTDLTPDTYYIGFANTPTGFTFSPQDADNQGTNGSSNSDVNPSTGLSNPIVLGAGEDNLNIDAGLVPPAGTAGLGDKVWFDLNNDGLQDANEPGVPGVQVSLLNSSGETIAVTTTDINGNYQFIGLTPGDYQVQFDNLPSGYDLTTQDADNTGVNGSSNSDADSTGKTSTITLAANQYNPNIDAGISSTTVASVGDYVWNDENGDGIQDPTEMGIGGVLVTLYDSSGNPVASTITNPDGSYIFTNVIPGDYTMGFDNLPGGMTFTQQNTGGNDSTDSDVDPTTGRTPTFTVTAGAHNPTIDAGLTTPILGGLGNYVWHDFNEDGVQDAGEPAVAGVVVTLYAADGTTVLAQAVTNGEGYYSFTDLPAGDYVIGFSNLPSGSTPTQSNGGLNTVLNSDMNPMTLKTTTVTLAGGEFNPNVDGGIYFGVPLPLNLTSFVITQANCNANLYWTTASEANTNYTEILRRQTNGSFKALGQVKSAGNSTTEQHYTFVDETLNPEVDNYIYKLRFVDIDGQFTYSEVRNIEVNCNTVIQDVRIFPNPASSRVNIFFTNVAEEDLIMIDLYNALGQKVLEQKIIKEQEETYKAHFDVSTLASGIYNLTIKGNGSLNMNYKITVE